MRHLGLKFVRVIDPRTSHQNIEILRSFGAEIDLVETPDPETGEFLRARLNRIYELLRQRPDSFWLNQYANEHNALAHRQKMHEIAQALRGEMSCTPERRRGRPGDRARRTNTVSRSHMGSSQRAGESFSTLVDLLRQRADEQPARTLYTFLSEAESERAHLTYQGLDARARAVAALLQQGGARGERVLLAYPSGPEFISAFFGCLYAGAVAVPVSAPRPNRDAAGLAATAADAQARLGLTTAVVLSRLSPAARDVGMGGGADGFRWLTTDDLDWEGLSGRWREPEIGGDSLAFLQYTSGSTSEPKGVMVSHTNLLHNEELIRQAFGQTEQSVIVTWLPLFHDMGLIGGVLQPLYTGARCVLMSPMSFLQQPARWLRAVARYRATTSGGPNFAYDLCVQKIGAEERRQLDLRSWEVAFNGAEPVRESTLESFAAAFAPCGFRREAFRPCYGLAEATLLVSGGRESGLPTVMSVRAEALARHTVAEADRAEEGARPVVGCGRPAPSQELVIVSPETGDECEAGRIGEIWLAGRSVARGYWNRPEVTGQTFGARLARTGRGPFLRTGDLGFVSGGELFITGRLKDIIIIRGRNFYPQDIERDVETSHPSLRPGCSAAFSIESGGEERLVVAAEVAPRTAATVAEDALAAISSAVAKGYDLNTHAVLLLKPGTLPKTSSGKVRRGVCRRRFLDGSLNIVASRLAQAAPAATEGAGLTRQSLVSVPPDRRSELLLTHLQAWLARLLGVDPTRLDRRLSLTAHGLDSLAAVELRNHVESELGVDLPFSLILSGVGLPQLAEEVLGRLEEAEAPTPPPACLREPEVGLPLSYNQRALWLMEQVAADSAPYNVTFAARLPDSPDVAALRRAFESLLARHAALRTTYAEGAGEPLQKITEGQELCFELTDASGWDDEALRERLSADASRPFDLARGPLLRIGLYTRSTGPQVLLLTVHHIAADFWSVEILLRELGWLYAAEVEGRGEALPPPRFNCQDFVRWQSEMLAGPAGERLRRYWERRLAGELPLMQLPADRPRPPVQTYRGAAHTFRLDAGLTADLRELARREDVTLYMLFLAAFQLLLSRYTGQTDVLVGAPASGRSRAEFEEVVGHFVNMVVLRADCSRGQTFRQFLAQVRRTVSEALDHQDYPFSLLVERLQTAHDPSRPPLVQVAFVYEKPRRIQGQSVAPLVPYGEAGGVLRLGGLTLAPFAPDQRSSQFDLTLMVVEMGDLASISLQYNTDIFEAETIARLATHFLSLLQSVAADPSAPLAALRLLSDHERRLLLRDWARGPHLPPPPAPLHRLVEEQARRRPEAVAVAGGGRSLTYAELWRMAGRVAGALRRRGVGPEAVVGVMPGRRPEAVALLLGVLGAGGAYLPLGERLPAARLAAMARNAGVRLIVLGVDGRSEGGGQREEALRGVGAVVGLEELLSEGGGEAEGLEGGGVDECAEVGPENLAYVIYTSGSTGQPKGVAVRHGGLMNLVEWHRKVYQSGPSTRAMQMASMTFDASVWELWPYLASGACVYLVDAETAASPAGLWQFIVRHGITHCFLPTPLAEAVLPLAAAQPADGGARPPALKYLLTGGDKLHPVSERHPPFTLVNHYGPTEATVVSTCATVDPDAPGDLDPPIGRPIANTRAYVLDAHLEPAPVGVPGELYVGGAGLARGYLGRPALTAERFIPDPFSAEPGARIYRTGDLVRYGAGGRIEFLGRADQQVKIRGVRIELEEIEAVLRSHDRVRESLVTVAGGDNTDRHLVAYFTPAGEPPAPSELRSFLKSRLPDYMVPAAFLPLEEFPLTRHGKLDRRALPAPLPAQRTAQDGYLAPRTDIEEVIADIWAETLGVRRVGVRDNFFELGGHSLAAARIASALRSMFQLELLLTDLFEADTVADLARLVAARETEPGRSEKIARILKMVRSMSKEDVKEALGG